MNNKNTINTKVLESTAKTLEKHGKNDNEIEKFLEEQFPISKAIVETILEKRKQSKKRSIGVKDDEKKQENV